MIPHIRKAYSLLITGANALQSPLLLIIRLYWGWQFFLTGKGKLMNLDHVTDFFANLHIPFPHQQAIFVGCVEMIGGLCLLLGLATRVISIPLMGTLIVAYLTADLEIVKNLFSDPDKFVTADEFLFLFATAIVFVFGPGKFSLDWLLGRRFAQDKSKA